MQLITLRAVLKNMDRLFIIYTLCILSGGATAVAQEINGEATYLLGSGDRLRIVVYGEANLSGEFEVDGTGVVSLPLVGEVKASGLGLREFGEVVTDALRDGYLVDPRVSVEVLNYRPFYILGEVRNPGKYPFITGITVLNAVAMAGGYTFRAREGRAEIIRDGESESLITKTPDMTPVMPGDIIRIPERFF